MNGEAGIMNRSSESSKPTSGAQSTTATAHRVALHSDTSLAYLSISPPLDAATLAEVTHLLDTWHAPTPFKALVLDLTACAHSSMLPSTENGAGKPPLESRQGRVRERALTVAQERALAALARIRAPILGVAAGTVPPPGCALLSCSDLLLAVQDTIFMRESGTLLAYRTPPARLGTTGAIGERLSAHRAYRQGLVTWLTPPEKLQEERERILALLKKQSATSLALAKQAFLLGQTHPNAPDIALEEIGRIYLHELMATPDAVEGLHAFLEKRPPVWKEAMPSHHAEPSVPSNDQGGSDAR
jgi:enoyl-CoA hydratase/carnithine racemase